MDKLVKRTKTINSEIHRYKNLLTSINVLYLIIAILMITGAKTSKTASLRVFNASWYPSELESLFTLWIITASFLITASIIGIITAITESTCMTKFYSLFLSLIIILQMAAAITAFTLITKYYEFLEFDLQYFNSYGDDNKIDWIQTTFHCCGKNDPSDWTEHIKKTNSYYYNPSQTEELGLLLPKSCCYSDSEYDYKKHTCDRYFQDGCHDPIVQIVSKSMITIGSISLAICVVQILGIVCARMFARTIRRNEINSDIQKWAKENMGFDRPVYVDQLSTVERRRGDRY